MAGVAGAFLSVAGIDPANPFLFHKTTNRSWYGGAVEQIRSKNLFDVIHINNRFEITEGSRSNVFVKIRGVLYTPPVACGLLPGVLRSRLLARGKCKERILRPNDLATTQEIYCGNSVRGLVRVRIINLNSESFC
jgi:para-aminobenzoate synthetase/4-amino-4-deoxychorismate lyase